MVTKARLDALSWRWITLKIDAAVLERRVLADPVNDLVFRVSRGYDLYLVGGNLRDVILNRRCTDRDFVVAGDPRRVAEIVASHTGGKMITLGDERLFRIVLPDRSTIDFSVLTDDIDTDLRRRDFTINSLAWSPQKGIVDPNCGLPDLRRRLLRMTNRENLSNDPIRILRAYRLSSEMDFAIEPETRGVLRALSPLLATEKPERITLEFFRIINVKDPVCILRMMLDDGVLQHIILRPDNDLRSLLKVISSVEKILDVPPLHFRFKLNVIFSQNLTYSGLLRLELLLRSNFAARLRISRMITGRLHLLAKGDAFKRSVEGEGLTIEEILFDLFEQLGGAAEDYLIINGMTELLPLCANYRRIMGKALLSTGDICRLTGLQEGQALGKLIRAVKKAEFYNEIKDKNGAREFLKLAQGKM